MAEERTTPTESEGSQAPTKQRRSIGWAPILASVAILVAAAAGWQSWQAQQQQQALQDQIERLSEQLSQRPAQVSDQLTPISSTLDAQRQRMAQLDEQVQAWQASLQALAEQIAEVKPNPEQDWLTAQANGLLRLAEQRVLLANDIDGGLALMQQARDVVVRLDDPKFYAVLQAIDEEILALQSLTTVAPEHFVSQLQALIEQIGELPLTSVAARQLEHQQATEQNWQSWLRSLVVIRKFDQQAPTVAPQTWVRAALRAQLEQAKALALLADKSGFDSQIEQINALLMEHVPESAARQAWQTQLQSLAEADMVITVPERLGQARNLLNGLED